MNKNRNVCGRSVIAPTMKSGRRPYGHDSVAVQNQGHFGPMCLNRPLQRRRGVFPLGPPGRSGPTVGFGNDRGVVGGVGRGWDRAQRQPHLFEHFNTNFCQSVVLSDVFATIRLKTENRPLSCIRVHASRPPSCFQPRLPIIVASFYKLQKQKEESNTAYEQ